MTLVSALIHALLALLFWSSVRDYLHPSVVFPSVWAMILLVIALAQPLGYLSVAPEALPIFLAGTLCFSASALLAGRKSISLNALPELDYGRLVKASILIHAVMLPLWWRAVTQIAGSADGLDAIAYALRFEAVQEGVALDFFSGNYLILGLILTPVLVIGALRGRIKGWLAGLVCAPWLITNVITNGRSGVMELALAVFFVHMKMHGRVRLRGAIVGFALFALLFGAGALLVGKTDATEDSSVSEITAAVAGNFLDYLIQGPILFSHWWTGAAHVAQVWDSLYLLTGKGQFAHADFNTFSNAGHLGNVYTIYFAQVPLYGVIGMMFLMLAYGLATGYVYRDAGRSVTHAVIMAYFFSAIVLSIFSDTFAPNLNFLVKTLIVTWVLQRFFRRGAASRIRTRRTRSTVAV